MSEVNYKIKYQELKMKFMNSVDTAFRLGYEQGMKDSQLQEMQNQQAQAQEAMSAQNGAPGSEESAPEGEQPGSEENEQEHPNGSELDQHIAKLEGMLGKSEFSPETQEELKKSISEIKSYKTQIDLKKSMKSIKTIGKNINQFKLGKTANHNLPEKAKRALNTQEQIVSSIMKSWDEQEKKVSEEIKKVLELESIISKA